MKMKQLFSRRKPSAGRLYAAIVAAARRPGLYGAAGAPDNATGRLAMIVLHLAVVIERLKQINARLFAQTLVEEFFADVEANLRESGVSDVAIPKRMREVEGLYVSLMAQLDAGALNDNAAALQAVLVEHVPGWPDPGQTDPGPVPTHVYKLRARLAGQELDAILRAEGWIA